LRGVYAVVCLPWKRRMDTGALLVVSCSDAASDCGMVLSWLLLVQWLLLISHQFLLLLLLLLPQ
jgi:hypothetical protein